MDAYHELLNVFTEIADPREMETFFLEIFSPKELKDLALRWQLLKELHEGQPQRSIAARHRISLCKITRGSKLLKQEISVTKKMLDTYYGGKG
jgi:TrpR family trp operon transcriptional repressor